MIDYKNLRDAGNSAKLENNELIVLILYHCLMFTAKKDGWLPEEYRFPSNLVDGADIYIWGSIKRNFKRPLLVHELAEFLFMYERFRDSLREPSLIREDVYDKIRKEAHSFARKQDDRFAKETLDEQTYKEYHRFRETIVNEH